MDLWGPNPQPSLLLLTCILGIRDEFLEAVFVLFNVLLLLSLNGCRFGVPVRKKNDFGNNTDKKPQSFVRKFGTKTNSISPDNTPSCTVKLHNSWRGTWYGSWTGTDACYLTACFGSTSQSGTGFMLIRIRIQRFRFSFGSYPKTSPSS